jgi:dipeptidyl aminopeptidase/acylaminoacyl peptidase
MNDIALSVGLKGSSRRKIMRHLVVVILLLFPVSFWAQGKHPFSFEDMMSLKRVSEPIVSPDGKWVLFSAVDVDLAANKKTAHSWVVPTAGGSAHEIIPDQDADRPRWAPDGKRFAFVSTKESGSQIWIADFDGTRGNVTGVHRLTAIATEAEGELWSPDGKNILFISSVYPECADEGCNQRKLEESSHSMVKAMIFSHLLYRHWNSYKGGKRSHLLIISAQGGSSRDLTPGDYDAPVFSLGGQDNYAFSPDGQEICYTSNHDPAEATSTNNDLWVVSVNGGEATNITAENKASDSTPVYSPDGNYIAYRAQAQPGYESDRFRLLRYDRKTRKIANLTESFDRWVGDFAWAPDSKAIYFTAEDKGQAPIYIVDRVEATGSRGQLAKTRLLVAGYNSDLRITPDGKTLVFSRMSAVEPGEIYASDASGQGCSAMTLDVDSGEEKCSLNTGRAITRVNEPLLSKVDMSKIESFWFRGAKGDEVEGFVVKPPNFDRNLKYPVKFLIHGGPQGAWGDDWSYRWNPELFAANGYVVVMINFHGSTGYGQKFIDAIRGDWGGAPFEDLMKGLDYAEQHYPFLDKDRECALGASYGGYMANWILGHSDRFKCIVSHDGMFNSTSAWGTTEELWFNEWEFRGTPYNNRSLYDQWSPHLSASNFKTPTLVIHGQLDYRLDVSEGFQLFTTLQRLGVPSKMLYFPDEGHWVLKPQNSELWYKTVNDWVDQWVRR